jgi:hypothetical protein
VDALEAHLLRQIEHSTDFFWHRLRWRAVAEHLPASGAFTLVDVGAGIGLLGEWLARDRPEAAYRFVEPISALEARLEARHGAGANARWEDAHRDAGHLALLDVLEHQPDDHAFLGDLVDRMRPGARLILTVPALMALWSQWDEALGHHRRYDRIGLARVVGALPVEIEELSYLFPELLPAAFVRRRARAGASGAEFPDLPPALNEALYRVGVVSLRARRLWPAGTSLLAVLRRR